MRCPVCGEMVGVEHFANAWEKTRNKYVCCSEDCARRFHPDQHWLPSLPPPAASQDDELRLLKVAAGRLRDGDRPRVVVRELLVAGIAPAGLRKITHEAWAASEQSRKSARELSFLSRLFGSGVGYQSRDRREPAALDEALDDLETWEIRFN